MDPIISAKFVKNKPYLVSINNGEYILASDAPALQVFTRDGGTVERDILSREEKIIQINTNTSSAILAEYPIWKQLNIANRIGYTDQDFATMQNFIKSVVDAGNDACENLGSVIDKESEE